jgi:predicted metalloprotease with PDZ domain
VDAPFEIGNHIVFDFTAAGVRHEVAMFGEGNYNIERLKKHMTTVVEKSTAVFGEHPCKYYLFIVHNLTSGGGGLEHKNSTTLQTNRWSYGSESSYAGFMSLVAHEYFHLWNVKRLRPQPLGPFNYDEENYTSMLWIAEGFTAYYDDLLAKRCGFYSENEYLKTLAGNISYVDNIRGGPYQSLAESSFDAWIKYYRPNENSGNSSVSYYTKGGVMGAMLDLQIRKVTANKKSLDDVFREMYLLYAKKLDRGYTEAEFIAMVNKISGKDFTAFFNDYVNGVKTVPFASMLQESGLVLNDLNKKQPAMWIGVTTSSSTGKLSVSAIERGSPAWVAGVNTGDEVLALDEYRVNDDLSKLLAMKGKGDKVTLLVSRNGFVKSFTMDVLSAPHVKYELSLASTATEEQKAMFNNWLYGSK